MAIKSVKFIIPEQLNSKLRLQYYITVTLLLQFYCSYIINGRYRELLSRLVLLHYPHILSTAILNVKLPLHYNRIHNRKSPFAFDPTYCYGYQHVNNLVVRTCISMGFTRNVKFFFQYHKQHCLPAFLHTISNYQRMFLLGIINIPFVKNDNRT